MKYMDKWIYNSNPRMKVFLCYFLIFVFIFIFSDVTIYFYTKSLYKPIEKYEINVENPKVEILEAVASNVNGSVKGIIKNNTNSMIINKYLKFEFYTSRDVNIGTEYFKIDSLQEEKEKEFKLGFKYDNISYFKVSLAEDSEIKNATPEQLKTKPPHKPVGLIFSLIH